MTDVHSKSTRSYNMSRIRSRGNLSTEQRLAVILRGAGIKGWRRHILLPGRPDFIFAKSKVAVFTDGCFWHACPTCGHIPKSNRSYWKAKLAANVARDKRARAFLRREGWRVVRIWEHELPEPRRAVKKIVRALQDSQRADGKVPS